MDVVKDNKRLEAEIFEEEKFIEKIKRQMVEQKKCLTKLKIDEVFIKQDRSTYESKIVDRFNVIEMCSEM